MFCPRCRKEYIEGIKICSDCKIELVPERPEEPHTEYEYIDYEQVLSTYNAGDIAFIKSLLDGEQIEYYLLGEVFNLLEPMIQPARLMVKKDQVKDVKELLKDITLNYATIHTGSPDSQEQSE